jgi:hypothetical protein
MSVQPSCELHGHCTLGEVLPRFVLGKFRLLLSTIDGSRRARVFGEGREVGSRHSSSPGPFLAFSPVARLPGDLMWIGCGPEAHRPMTF